MSPEASEPEPQVVRDARQELRRSIVLLTLVATVVLSLSAGSFIALMVMPYTGASAWLAIGGMTLVLVQLGMAVRRANDMAQARHLINAWEQKRAQWVDDVERTRYATRAHPTEVRPNDLIGRIRKRAQDDPRIEGALDAALDTLLTLTDEIAEQEAELNRPLKELSAGETELATLKRHDRVQQFVRITEQLHRLHLQLALIQDRRRADDRAVARILRRLERELRAGDETKPGITPLAPGG